MAYRLRSTPSLGLPKLSIPLMTRSGDLSAEDVLNQKRLAEAMIQNSVNPQVEEKSWAQGAARLAQALIGNYKLSKVREEQANMANQRSADLQLLGQALSGTNGANISQVMNQLHDPSAQMMALNLLANQRGSQDKMQQAMAMQNLKNQGAIDVMKAKLPLSQQMENYKAQAKFNTDPAKIAQKNLADTMDNIAAVQNSLAQEQDPNKRAALQGMLQRLQGVQTQYTNQLLGMHGQMPNAQKQALNDAFNTMASNNSGIASLPQYQQLAIKTSGMNPLGQETEFQKALSKGEAAPLIKRMSDFEAEAAGSAQQRMIGERLLQEMAANPDLKSGPGVQTQTNIKNFINNLFPGAMTPQGEQELFQKGVGTLTLGGIDKLRGSGVQRITQNEIQYVVPLFTPTMMNSKEGIKDIIELHNAIDPVIQKGAMLLADIKQKARQDPSINVEQAYNNIIHATQSDAQQVSMNYMNAKLASEGKKIVINPTFDPLANPKDKYMQADMSPQEISDYQTKHQVPQTATPIVPQPNANTALQNAQGNIPLSNPQNNIDTNPNNGASPMLPPLSLNPNLQNNPQPLQQPMQPNGQPFYPSVQQNPQFVQQPSSLQNAGYIPPQQTDIYQVLANNALQNAQNNAMNNSYTSAAYMPNSQSQGNTQNAMSSLPYDNQSTPTQGYNTSNDNSSYQTPDFKNTSYQFNSIDPLQAMGKILQNTPTQDQIQNYMTQNQNNSAYTPNLGYGFGAQQPNIYQLMAARLTLPQNTDYSQSY